MLFTASTSSKINLKKSSQLKVAIKCKLGLHLIQLWYFSKRLTDIKSHSVFTIPVNPRYKEHVWYFKKMKEFSTDREKRGNRSDLNQTFFWFVHLLTSLDYSIWGEDQNKFKMMHFSVLTFDIIVADTGYHKSVLLGLLWRPTMTSISRGYKKDGAKRIQETKSFIWYTW